MKIWSALRLTPAAIIRLANVWRHSCKPMGSRPRRSRISRPRSPARTRYGRLAGQPAGAWDLVARTSFAGPLMVLRPNGRPRAWTSLGRTARHQPRGRGAATAGVVPAGTPRGPQDRLARPPKACLSETDRAAGGVRPGHLPRNATFAAPSLSRGAKAVLDRAWPAPVAAPGLRPGNHAAPNRLTVRPGGARARRR